MSRKKQVYINKKILLVIIIAIIIAIIVTCNIIQKNKKTENNGVSTNIELNLEQYPEYKWPVQYYYVGILNKDSETYKKAYPDFDNLAKEMTNEQLENCVSRYSADLGDNVTMTYEYVNEYQSTDAELSDINTYISQNNVSDVTISEAYTIKVKETYTGSNSSFETEKTFFTYKMNGTWYIE